MERVLEFHIAERNASVRAEKGDKFADAYLPILQERADMYAAHVAQMQLPPDAIMWSLAMRAKYGTPYVMAWMYVADWLTALLIVIYGEEPRMSHTRDGVGWPNTITAQMSSRMSELLTGEKWSKTLKRLPDYDAVVKHLDEIEAARAIVAAAEATAEAAPADVAVNAEPEGSDAP